MSISERVAQLIRPSSQSRVKRNRRATARTMILAPLARSGAGKTATAMAEAKCVEGCHLQSGLMLRGPSMLEIIEREDRIQALIKQAKDGRIPSTQRLLWGNNHLYDGDNAVLEVQKFDPIGQRLTEVRSNSDESELRDFHELLDLYARATVLQVMVPILPADPSPADEQRFEKDLRVATMYLHESLVNSRTGHTRAVVIVPTKLDSLWMSASAATAELTDRTLRVMFAPLVNVVQKSERVEFAAITPITSFGFGNSRIEDSPVETVTYHGEDEALGILEGEMQPFNVLAMVVWSLLAGLRCTDDSTLADVEAALRRDLAAVNGWVVPLKGDV